MGTAKACLEADPNLAKVRPSPFVSLVHIHTLTALVAADALRAGAAQVSKSNSCIHMTMRSLTHARTCNSLAGSQRRCSGGITLRECIFCGSRCSRSSPRFCRRSPSCPPPMCACRPRPRPRLSPRPSRYPHPYPHPPRIKPVAPRLRLLLLLLPHR